MVKITLELITKSLTEFLSENPNNAIQASYALDKSLVGIPFFESPLVASAAADDPIFDKFKNDPAIIGPAFILPNEWLPGAKSVISFFLPFTEEFRNSNKSVVSGPSHAWCHGRKEGQQFLMLGCEHIAKVLRNAGYEAIIPAGDPRCESFCDSGKVAMGQPMYVSTWSERHVAFAAGLGTFGLTKYLITEKGACGRLGSIITTAPIEVTPRPYTEPYEYCTFCGACARRCPVNAISREKGKDMMACSARLNEIGKNYTPKHGCEKCQIDLPCTTKIPKKLNKSL